jgi:hypothetical protein
MINKHKTGTIKKQHMSAYRSPSWSKMPSAWSKTKLPLSPSECSPLCYLTCKAERMLLREKRYNAAHDYIRYLCRGLRDKGSRGHEHTYQKCAPGFVEHCLDLYTRQKGLCAITEERMTWEPPQLTFSSTEPRPCAAQISIDRIDNAKGYVVGNVRLVCWYINNMLGDFGYEVYLHFAQRICHMMTKQMSSSAAPMMMTVE